MLQPQIDLLPFYQFLPFQRNLTLLFLVFDNLTTTAACALTCYQCNSRLRIRKKITVQNIQIKLSFTNFESLLEMLTVWFYTVRGYFYDSFLSFFNYFFLLFFFLPLYTSLMFTFSIFISIMSPNTPPLWLVLCLPLQIPPPACLLFIFDDFTAVLDNYYTVDMSRVLPEGPVGDVRCLCAL